VLHSRHHFIFLKGVCAQRYMALVLCAGVDPALIKTRQLILERAGHTVVPATDERAMITACEMHAFDVAVIGQKVPPKLKRKMLSLIREHSPSTKVLEMYMISTGRTLEDADAWLEALGAVPQEFADRVAALVLKRKSDQVQE
jgi:CheY-like chemotaxis protein